MPPVRYSPKVPPKILKSAINGNDGEHKTPYLFDDAHDTCCCCG